MSCMSQMSPLRLGPRTALKRITEAIGLLLLVGATGTSRAEDAIGTKSSAPIIDMHLHAYAADENGPPPLGLCPPIVPHLDPLDPQRDVFKPHVQAPACAKPIWSATTDQDVMQGTIDVLERRNIIGVLSGEPERVKRWLASAPERFIPSIEFAIGPKAPSPAVLRRLFETGPFRVLGEVSNQYRGIGPGDKRMEPYWALAEDLDIPVAIHMGEGPAGASRMFPKYRAALSSPYLLEEVLSRHPRLRVSVMHCGSPLFDETIAVLGAYPQVYVDLGGIQWFYPREFVYAQLKKLIDAGFAKRVMFGSDQMVWPGVIEPAIAILEEAPFLTEAQKRDIFYNNAARFLRLTSSPTRDRPKDGEP
jgi:predicted TIM-barrel fold metal-dependent hydrolase